MNSFHWVQDPHRHPPYRGHCDSHGDWENWIVDKCPCGCGLLIPMTKSMQDKPNLPKPGLSKDWRKRFDKKFIMPESHLGKDYWEGEYTPRVWGKYQNMKAIKQFIASEIKHAVEETNKSWVESEYK